MNDNNIFVKKHENVNVNKETKSISLSKEHILESIPKGAVFSPNENLGKNKMELRWRFFKFPDRENEIIEISYKKPNNNRMYFNQQKKWIECESENMYDKYLVKSYYHYQDTNDDVQ